jgi:hypothetical protein
MKRTTMSLLSVAIALVLFSGCKDLLDVEKDFIFEKEIVVKGNPLTFMSENFVDLTEDNDLVDEYGDKIKEMDIEQVRYWVKSHNGTATQALTTGTLKVANADNTDPQTIVSLQQIVFSTLIQNPQVLQMNPAGVNKLNKKIKEPPHTFTLFLDGTLNEGPADFVVVFEFSGRMTANPLN